MFKITVLYFIIIFDQILFKKKNKINLIWKKKNIYYKKLIELFLMKYFKKKNLFYKKIIDFSYLIICNSLCL